MFNSRFKKVAQAWLAPLFFSSRFLLALVFVQILVACSSDTEKYSANFCNDLRCSHPIDVLKPFALEEAKLVRLGFVKQRDQMGCGAAAISSVLKYWDRTTSYDEIVSKFPSASNLGYAVRELKEIAFKFQLKAFSLPMTEEFLKENLSKGRPIIIPVKKYRFKLIEILPNFIPFREKITYSHYLVIFGFDEEGYWVMDPAEGYQYSKADKLREIWKLHNFAGLLISS